MAQQTINVGSAPDDGTGDPLRVAFTKCNANFTELYTADTTFLTTIAAATTYQPLDADLTSLAAAGAVGSLYYRASAGSWSPVTIGTGLTFTSGTLAATGGGGTATPGPPQGRLTLQTLTPVMTTTQAAKTTLFYTPYAGNQIPLFDGTNFVMTAFNEISVLTTDTTKNPAAIGASKVNDWFVWNDAGTLRLTHGPDWTDDVTRSAGTSLFKSNGLLLNAFAITNGPANNRGTYVGTTRSNASSQLDWIYGTAAVGGGAAFFGVWNCYNRVDVSTTVIDTTSTWVSANTTRALNNSLTNRVSAVAGLAEDIISAMVHNTCNAPVGTFGAVGINLNSTTGPTMNGTWSSASASGGAWSAVVGQYNSVQLGFNFWQAMEAAGISVSFAGIFGGSVNAQSGLYFNARM